MLWGPSWCFQRDHPLAFLIELFFKLDLSIILYIQGFVSVLVKNMEQVSVLYVYCSTYTVHNFIGFLLFIVQFDNGHEELM